MRSNTLVRALKLILIILGILIILIVSTVIGFNYFVPILKSPVSILVLGKGGEGHTAPD